MVEDTLDDVHEPDQGLFTRENVLPALTAATVDLKHRSTASTAQYGERLKYTLATSSLLTPRLADALPAYPSLEEKHVEAPSHAVSAAIQIARAKGAVADWGTDWASRGQSWRDRGFLGNLHFARSAVNLVRAANHAAHPMHSGTERGSSIQSASFPCADTTTAAAENFIKVAQQVDIRISRALGGIKEIECVTWGLGL